MADGVKMRVINGIRYRPEDAPEEEVPQGAEHKMRTAARKVPANKGR